MIYDLEEKLPPLTKREEQELFKRYGRGDVAAKDTLVMRNLGLVVREASKRIVPHMTIEDLSQEGVIGLIRAIEKYEWERGLKFSTYAIPWIQHEMQRAVDNKSRLVRLPVNDSFKVQQMKNYRNRVATKEGREVTDEEMMEKFKLEPERYAAIERFRTGTLPSLDKLISPDGATELGDLLPDANLRTPEEISIDSDARRYIRERVDELDEPDRSIIIMRFALDGGDPVPYSVISKTLGVPYAKTQKLERAILERMSQDQGIQTTARFNAG